MKLKSGERGSDSFGTVSVESVRWRFRQWQNAGYTRDQIADIHGFSHATVCNILLGKQEVISLERRAQAMAVPLPPTPERDEWRDRAKCKGMDPNLFDVDKQGEAYDQRAVDACNACPVRRECLQSTMPPAQVDHHAYLGGMTPKQRRTARRKFTRAQAAFDSLRDERVAS